MKDRLRDVTHWFGLRFSGRENETEPIRAAPPGAAAGRRADKARRKPGRIRVTPWTEDPETCDTCSRRLLVGETPALMQRDDEKLVVCPLCASDLLLAGFNLLERPDAEERGPRGKRLRAA